MDISAHSESSGTITHQEAELQFEIKPYNIDAAGHVNNAVYINWLEDLRTRLFRQICPLDDLISKGYYLVVASTSIEYKKPLYLPDKPVGKIKVDAHERGIWLLSAVIKLNESVVVKAKQKCVFINRTTKKMAPSNEILRNELTGINQ